MQFGGAKLGSEVQRCSSECNVEVRAAAMQIGVNVGGLRCNDAVPRWNVELGSATLSSEVQRWSSEATFDSEGATAELRRAMTHLRRDDGARG